MNSSLEMDAKEAEIQRQKELIGEMPFKRIVEKVKDHKPQQHEINGDENNLKEKENQSPENGIITDEADGNDEMENKEKTTTIINTKNNNRTVAGESDTDGSTVSVNGSSPETLPRNDIPDNIIHAHNGSADSSDAAGSPVSTPLNPDIITTNDDILNSTNLTAAAKLGILNTVKEAKDINKSIEKSYNSKSFNEFEEADDELSSTDGNSFDTVKHYPMGNQNTDTIDYGSTARALETLQKSQEDLKRKAKEEEAAQLRAQQTYILPSVLSYNYNKEKKTESDSDSDAELFLASEQCRQCDTIRRDPKMKTKVCTLM